MDVKYKSRNVNMKFAIDVNIAKLMLTMEYGLSFLYYAIRTKIHSGGSGSKTWSPLYT